MTVKAGSFDAASFYDALDAVRHTKKVTWRDVADGSGVSASTLTRMAQGKRPDVDSLAALCAWSGLRADDFVTSRRTRPHPEPIAAISTLLKGDKNLTQKDAEMLSDIIKASYAHLRKNS